MEQGQIDVKQISEDIKVLKKEVAEIKDFIKEDLEFQKSVEQSWEDYEMGDVVDVSIEELANELKKW